MIRLVVFLGNYGREYEKTRHNVAWIFEKSLSITQSLSWQKKFNGNYASTEIDGQRIYFLKPETYMNNSGLSIIEIANFFKIKAEETLVVHDELELPFGTVSFKWAGGLGGHNGLRSTKAVFNTADFWRLRFGISKPSGANIADYVLSPFSQDEQISLNAIFKETEIFLSKVLRSTDPKRFLPEWSKKKLMVNARPASYEQRI
ncbi:MAG: aminoacyl-tRNA hydrolase [Treponema sp.]|nr:aminoacyl-tRNA hydrolase [Treponema sp.]